MRKREPMRCPNCQSNNHKATIIVRRFLDKAGSADRWARKCRECGHVFTRMEVSIKRML